MIILNKTKGLINLETYLDIADVLQTGCHSQSEPGLIKAKVIGRLLQQTIDPLAKFNNIKDSTCRNPHQLHPDFITFFAAAQDQDSNLKDLCCYPFFARSSMSKLLGIKAHLALFKANTIVVPHLNDESIQLRSESEALE